jgi:L-iditol 2-dehydrogenase
MMAWPTKTFYPLPDALSDIEGAMLEPLGVAIHSSDLGHVKPGYRIAILGCGPIGILLVQLARLVGATQIIATDKLPHRVDAAHEFGATQAYTVGGRERDAELWSITEGEGFDVVFEVAGENDAVETALEIARPGGQIVLAGIPADDQITFSASIARRKGLTFRAVRRMKHTYSRAIRLVESGKVDVRSVVTHCYSLKEFQTAFDVASRRDGLKVIIQP